jgi:hypothetical protein
MTDINIILADHPRLGRVRLCECNSIHLSLGPVTINLEPHAFAQALTLMRSAMEQLEEIVGSPQKSNSLDRFNLRPDQLPH